MKVNRKTGSERFRAKGEDLDFDLLSFWQWADSNLVSNTARGRLAEYVVARAVGLGISDMANDWEAFDLLTPCGLKLEVKSASYVQTWFQKDLSKIVFNVQPKRKWDPSNNVLDKEPKRHADIYIFALLTHADQDTIDPLNLDQWEFYVVATSLLDNRKRSQHSITLKSLKQLIQPVSYTALYETIEVTGKTILAPV